jgi:hypothetical protein
MFVMRVLLGGYLIFVAIGIVAANDQHTALRPIPDVGEPFDVKSFASAIVPYRNNAFTAYRHAHWVLAFPFRAVWQKEQVFARTNLPAFRQKQDETFANGWPRDDADLRQWIAAGESALEIWKRGTECTNARELPPGATQHLNIDPENHPAIDLARLACLKAAQLIAAQRPADAWAWYCAVLRFSRQLEMHSDLTGRQVGQSIARLAEVGIKHWAALPQVKAVDLRRALVDVLALREQAVPLADSLKGEYLVARQMIESGESDEFYVPYFGEYLRFLGSDVRARQILNVVYTNLLSQADRPRYQRPLQCGRLQLFARGPLKHLPTSFYSDEEIEDRLLAFPLDEKTAKACAPDASAFEDFDRERLQQSALILGLALELHFREHDEFPSKLDELVTWGYLKSLPDDPFGSHETLHYRLAQDSARKVHLWSLWNVAIDEKGNVDSSKDPADEEGEGIFQITAPAEGTSR